MHGSDEDIYNNRARSSFENYLRKFRGNNVGDTLDEINEVPLSKVQSNGNNTNAHNRIEQIQGIPTESKDTVNIRVTPRVLAYLMLIADIELGNTVDPKRFVDLVYPKQSTN